MQLPCQIGVELSLRSDYVVIDRTVKLIDALESHKDEIEKEIGQKLVWEKGSHTKIGLYPNHAFEGDATLQLNTIRTWLIPTTKKFYDVLKKWLGEVSRKRV